jgi:hypothetical protein
MIWDTAACDDQVYDNITRGAYGCMTDSEGYITCDETPRPDCCFAPMHDFARVYSIICFVFLGVICFVFLGLMMMTGKMKQEQPEA